MLSGQGSLTWKQSVVAGCSSDHALGKTSTAEGSSGVFLARGLQAVLS